MNQLILKSEIVEGINKDAELYGKVAKSLGIGAPSLRYLLRVNSPKLTQAASMEVLMVYFGVAQYSDLLTEMQEPLKQSA